MTKKIKILAIVCCMCLLFNISLYIFNNKSYATNNVTLDFNDTNVNINEGVANFNVNNQNIEVKLAVKNNETKEYTYESITDHMSIDLYSKDYYLYINKTDEQNVTLTINGNNQSIPGDNYFGLYSEDFSNVLVIDLQSGGNSQGGNHEQPLMREYDVIAKFQGVTEGIISDSEGNILMPEGWTSGEVEFYAKSIMNEEEPEVRLDIEGIANGQQINRTVGLTGTKENEDMKAIFTEEFQDYGKALFHLGSSTGINISASINTRDLIFVKASAPLKMSNSLGSVAIDNTILTNKQTGNVSIFFGNTETVLKAEGETISKIAKVVGGASVEYNDDGTATVKLPSLSKETTTKLTLTIELTDETTITRNVNVVRTAIELGFNRAAGNATLEAGYIVNKAYLYNNQNHNDEIFNAYLQVILYKDGVVAGYRQVKIDDERLINSLQNDKSGTMELVSDDHINLYGKELDDTIEGVNSASVFLTNGPIEFENELPSVEFGIGSGVTINFGGEE